MKNSILFFLLIAFTATGYSTTWTVTSPGFAFSPATLTIQEGDDVVFNIDNIHTVVEVSQATWNNNQNNPLSGGFSLPSGGGTLSPSDLEPGTHWYVCGPHASGGMKGMIVVQPTTATEEPTAGLALSLNPNPSTGKFQVSWTSIHSAQDYAIDVMDISGKIIFNTTGTGDRGSDQFVDINLSTYPKGYYFVRLRNNDGIQTKKLILQ